MSNAIPFEDWLDKQGDDVFLAMCDGHPSTIILIDKTDFAVYRYTNDKAENDRLRELVEDMLSCIEIQIAFDHTPEKWMYEQFAVRAQELRIEVDG